MKNLIKSFLTTILILTIIVVIISITSLTPFYGLPLIFFITLWLIIHNIYYNE
jgi:hypothetical protein